jgi:copper transport protein
MSVAIEATLGGVYVVRWQVVGEDTHPSRGRFVFWVGPPASVPANLGQDAVVGDVAPLGLALQALSRWTHFLGYALSLGVIALQVVLARAGLGGTEPAGRRLRQLVDVGILLLLVSEPLALFGQTASVDPSEIVDPVAVSAAFDSSFGRVFSLRLGALLFLWVLLGFANAGSAWGGPASLAVGVALAFVDASSAHALSVRPAWLGLVVGAIHLMAAGAWFGGLAGLIAIWQSGVIDRRPQLIVSRFGPLAIGSVIVLAATGLLMLWWHLGIPEGGGLTGFGTDYGRALLAKVALAFGALVVAWLGQKSLPKAWRRWWLVELTGLIAVLALAGLLVSVRPPV